VNINIKTVSRVSAGGDSMGILEDGDSAVAAVASSGVALIGRW